MPTDAETKAAMKAMKASGDSGFRMAEAAIKAAETVRMSAVSNPLVDAQYAESLKMRASERDTAHQEEELVESVAYAISQTCDMDVTWEMYARSAIAAYRETKAKLLAETEKS
jgi:hypothetical protein